MKKSFFFLVTFIANYFFAQPEIGGKKVDRNVIYGMYSGLALLMDVHYPETPNGIGLIHVSGSGFTKPLSLNAQPLNHQGHVKLECEGLLKNGFTIFTINHRAAPRFKFPAPIEDVQRAIRFVRYHAKKYNINPDKIGAIGGSSGGNIVLMSGMLDGDGNKEDLDVVNKESSKVQAIIARAPVTTFTHNFSYSNSTYLGVRGKEMTKIKSPENKIALEASPISHISKDDPPVLFMHGEKDSTVPISHSLIMIDSLKKYGVKTKLKFFQILNH